MTIPPTLIKELTKRLVLLLLELVILDQLNRRARRKSPPN